MTKETILRKAISKAVKNGYKPKFPVAAWFQLYPGSKNMFEYKGELNYKDYYVMIFSHDFAKAFWGKEWVCTACGKETELEEGEAGICEHNYSIDGQEEAFEYHLKQMVLEKDPIKYMGKFI